ncbi:hypothetical protein PTTG_12768 [Puccinia triticina 1-1 BBBD Race 1]|uniref:Uncharacterized protein n=1 Tax=Puccinia triticina (isolate 1-1 / race 1 (BBBD)) TaxID=630390 RepID=A0A180GW02_PUCT1|nr:hypothetical protein PTTG_12768 [Puccinia triticina 1-1 BBBD Race 1]
MVSLAHLITLLSVLVAASRAEEVSGAKNEDVDAKWLGGFGGMYNSFYSLGGMGLGMFGSPWINSLAWSMGGACFGGAFFPMNMALGMGGFFAKASEQEATHSVSRRAIHLDADHLLRRTSADSVTCTSSKGVSEVFSKSQCLKAAQTLREKSLHSASNGSCQLSLHNSKDKVVAKAIPDHILQKAVNSILSTCNEKSTPKDTKTHHIDDKQVLMILSRH